MHTYIYFKIVVLLIKEIKKRQTIQEYKAAIEKNVQHFVCSNKI